MFQTELYRNQNTHFMFKNFFPKTCLLWDNAEKYRTTRQATDYKIIRHMRLACLITEAADTHTHTHTHTEYVILIALPRQQWFRDAPQCFVCTCVACLFLCLSLLLPSHNCISSTCCNYSTVSSELSDLTGRKLGRKSRYVGCWGSAS